MLPHKKTQSPGAAAAAAKYCTTLVLFTPLALAAAVKTAPWFQSPSWRLRASSAEETLKLYQRCDGHFFLTVAG